MGHPVDRFALDSAPGAVITRDAGGTIGELLAELSERLTAVRAAKADPGCAAGDDGQRFLTSIAEPYDGLLADDRGLATIFQQYEECVDLIRDAVRQQLAADHEGALPMKEGFNAS